MINNIYIIIIIINMEQSKIPNMFICSISHDIMKDPVVDPEGNSYEKSAIEMWLSTNETSPVTRSSLTVANLAPNRALRNAIEDYVAKNPTAEVPKDTSDNLDMKDIDNTVTINSDGMNIQDKTIISVNINTPEYTKGTFKPPMDIVIIVDTSGSMGKYAPTKDASGNEEDSEFCVLDIVKHAINTVIDSSTEFDRIGIVTYNNESTIVLDLTPMDVHGKMLTTTVMRKFFPKGQTNLWSGLHNGLKLLHQNYIPGRITNIMLFTDGQPNIRPNATFEFPNGETKMLKLDMKQNPDHKITIDTFGFGNDINEDVLIDLSLVTNGSFKYISDPGMVGTIFINHIASQYTTITKNAVIEVEPLNSLPISNIIGHYPVLKSEYGYEINIYSIQYENDKSIIMEVVVPDDLDDGTPLFNMRLKYINRYNEEIVCESILCYNKETFEEVKPDIFFHYIKYYSVDEILKALKCGNNAQQIQIIVDLISHIEGFQISHKNVDMILIDLKGQIQLAFIQYMHTWGKYYIPSLMFAYQQCDCLNFKDASVQMYGGNYFKELRESIENRFVNEIPIPKPCCKPYDKPVKAVYTQADGTRNVPVKSREPRTNMSQYNNVSGGCFTGDTQIHINESESINISDIKKGDTVLTVNKQLTKVICVIEFKVCNPKIVRINNLGITPWHPIQRLDSIKWAFPVTIGKSHRENTNVIYNLVLDSGHIIIVDNYECVTFGHNLESEVVKHDFFGDKIIDELQNTKGWDNGLIKFKEDCFICDNEVVGIDLSKEC